MLRAREEKKRMLIAEKDSKSVELKEISYIVGVRLKMNFLDPPLVEKEDVVSRVSLSLGAAASYSVS